MTVTVSSKQLRLARRVGLKTLREAPFPKPWVEKVPAVPDIGRR